MYRQPPEGSLVLCLDETARSYPGQQLVFPTDRARQEADYGRRGKGYLFGAFRPATGVVFTRPLYYKSMIK